MPFPGQKTPRGPFPLVPHCAITAKFRNISGLTTQTSHSLTTPVTTARPSHVLLPSTRPIVAEAKRPFPEFDRRKSNLLSRATKSRDPDFATWLYPCLRLPLPIMPSLFLSFLLLSPLVPASLIHTLADDLYAFPKYRVTFLNGLPLLNETAERWLREGLLGG